MRSSGHRRTTLAIALLMAWPIFAHATNMAVVSAHSRYMQLRREVNMDGPDAMRTLTDLLQHWLRLQRAIEHQPVVARRLARHYLTYPGTSRLLSPMLDTQARRAGMKPDQVGNQSILVYTWHIMSYRKASTLRSFLKSPWFSQRLPRRQVYRKQPKQFKLFVDGGDVVAKEDPLYVEPVTRRGQHLTRLCYGIYASAADAKRDRRVLQRYLGMPLRLIRRPLTEQLVQHVWADPVGGYYFDSAEELSSPYPR